MTAGKDRHFKKPMGNVLQFKQREKTGPIVNEHGKLEGWATCQQCNHKWYASEIQTGNIEIQCPKCRTAKGLFMYGHEGSESSLICECLCHVFTISESRVICWRCGKEQVMPDGY